MRSQLAGRYSTQSASMSTTGDGLLFLKLLTLLLWGIKTDSRASEAVLWQNFMTREEALRICLVLLHVAPPLLFTVTSFPDMPTNNLTAPSPSLKVHVYHYNKCDMRNLREQNFTIVFAPRHSISTGPTFYPSE